MLPFFVFFGGLSGAVFGTVEEVPVVAEAPEAVLAAIEFDVDVDVEVVGAVTDAVADVVPAAAAAAAAAAALAASFCF